MYVRRVFIAFSIPCITKYHCAGTYKGRDQRRLISSSHKLIVDDFTKLTFAARLGSAVLIVSRGTSFIELKCRVSPLRHTPEHKYSMN